MAGEIYRRDKTRDYGYGTGIGLGVWEAPSGRNVSRLLLQKVRNARLTGDGRNLVVLHPDRLALWELATRKEILSWPVPPLDGFGSIALFLREEAAQRFQELGFQMGGFSMIGLIIAWQVFNPISDPIFTLALRVLYPGYGYGS